MDGRTFDTDIRRQLAPSLERGDVVILDNLNVHKSPRAAQALAERGAWFLFLPKYSPPISAPRLRVWSRGAGLSGFAKKLCENKEI
ncbi:MAG: hypothetical protein HC850_14560 [Rhodomicrobium sp.]|nr:hypothetical protein [Rhodomicrobium sp.]